MIYIKNNQVNYIYSNNLTSGSTTYYLDIRDIYTGVTCNLTYNNNRYSIYTLTTTGKTNINLDEGKIYLRNYEMYNYDMYYYDVSGTTVVETGIIYLSGTTAVQTKMNKKVTKNKFINRE